jgi:type I restriction enzyme, S subunit
MSCWLGMKGWAVSERKALVPKLRFLEFRAMDPWTEEMLGPYLLDCSGRVPSDTVLPIYSSTREGLRRQDSYFDGQVLQNKNEYGVVPPNCFVYRHMSDDGLFKFNINETGHDIAVSKEYPVFKTKDLNPQFLLALFNEGFEFKKFALSQKAGGTRTRLYFSRLSEWRTVLPPQTEQKKIADCLSSADKLIAAQTRKVDALKTHKKGLMQQLFPREGKSQPRLRFPEFEAAADWEVKKLEGLAKRGSGHTPSKNHPEYYGGGIKWISLADSKRLDAGLISETETEISAQGVKKSSAVLHAAGTVLVSRDAGVGKSAVMAAPMAVSQHFIVWTCHAHLLSNWFLYYLLQEMKPIFERIATGSTIKTIGLPFFKELRRALPALPEQQRIANCLSSLDDLISAATQELDTLKIHKKGLMQQLFPPTEALDA